jgi:hypothetical protein
MEKLSKLDLPKEVKCEKHNTYLDKFCYKCRKQFCSECDSQTHIGCSPVKKVEKTITKEKLEETKKIINEYKNSFKQYIKNYMEQYFVKQEDFSKEMIMENLLMPYIQTMIYFFQFNTEL